MLLALAIAGLFVLPGPWNVVGVVVAAGIEVVELYLWRRFLRRYRIRVGAEAMVGERAVALSALDPEGRVRIRGEIWRARSSVPVGAGDRVRVSAVDGLSLEVEPIERLQHGKGPLDGGPPSERTYRQSDTDWPVGP